MRSRGPLDDHLLAAQSDVDMFMSDMGQTIRDWPSVPTPAEIRLRIALIEEEYDETIDALGACLMSGSPSNTRLAALADGIGDLIYVLLGTASAFGIDMSPVWREIQRSNMEKASGPVREDGKRLKPDDWTAPDIISAILQQYPQRED